MIILIIFLFLFYCICFITKEIRAKAPENYVLDISNYDINLKHKYFDKMKKHCKDNHLSNLFFNKTLNIKGHKSEIVKFV